MAQQIVNVLARVVRPPRYKEQCFVVHLEQMNRNLTVNFGAMFLPLRENDIVNGYCKTVTVNGSMQLELINPPYVTMPCDRDGITKCFFAALRGQHGAGTTKIAEWIYMFSSRANGLDKMASYLDNLSIMYNETKNYDMLKTFDNIEATQLHPLLLWWFKNRVQRQLYLFGLNNKELKSMEHRSYTEILRLCNEAPHQLVELSILKCDEILLRQNKQLTGEEKRLAAIVRILHDNSEHRGWTCTPIMGLKNAAPDCDRYLADMHKVYGCVTDFDAIYLPYQHRTEKELSIYFNMTLSKERIVKREKVEPQFTRKDLSSEQKVSIVGALNNKISLITGGPGTGKSTIIGELAAYYKSINEAALICCFTGKATARVREITRDAPSSTLHMAIARGDADFKHLIIDELSMVSYSILLRLITKYSHDFTLTLLGDDKQLQPISWGSLLCELLACGKIPHFRLIINHRTEIPDIIVNMHNIVNGPQMTEDGDMCESISLVPGAQFKMIEGNMHTVNDTVSHLAKLGLSSEQLIVLCPYNKDLDIINAHCQHEFNGTQKQCIDSKGRTIRMCDRLMMVENNYTIDVYNGEEGNVVEINDKSIAVDFHGNRITFSLTIATKREEQYHKNKKEEVDVSELQHSFATTIHKAQGSERDFVILYIPETKSYSFVDKNLIYTAISRARRGVIVIGNLAQINMAVNRCSRKRIEYLARRIL